MVKKTISVKEDTHSYLLKLHRGGETWEDFLLRLADTYDGKPQTEILREFLKELVDVVYERKDRTASFAVIESIGKDVIIEMLSK